jgi:hypothetical protein
MPNTATVTVDEGVSDQDSHEVDILHPAITITKVPDPQSGPPGTPVTFTYTVTNSGDVTLTNVSVDDNVLGHIGDVASLAPGETVVLTASTVIGDGSVTNIAIAGGTDPLGTKVSDDAQATISPVIPPAQVQGEAQVRGEELARTGAPISRWMAGALLALSFGLMFLAGSELIASRVAYAEVTPKRARGGKHLAPESRMKRGLRLGASVVAAGWIYRSINRRK